MKVARIATVGLIADPGLPERVAEQLAEDLGRDLEKEVGGLTNWRVEVTPETLPLTDTGEIPLLQYGPLLLDAHGWDVVVYLTDLPRRHGSEPILAEFSVQARTVLVCLPALGAWRVAPRTRALLVPMLAYLAGYSDDAAAAARATTGTTTEHTTAGNVQYLIRPGRINDVRLPAGMVRNNQPGSLLPALSSTAAAGVGTGAFGIFYATIWMMADSLPPARLALISVAVITALTLWLVFYNGLWTTDRGIGGWGSPWLDNVATIITVGMSVALMYVLLYLALFVAALTIITPDYLTEQLEHPVTILDYLRLSWLAASLGTMGGAIGSNFDSDISEATYSRREYERRRLAKDGGAA